MTIEQAFNDLLKNWGKMPPAYKSKYKIYKSRYLNLSGNQTKKVSKDKQIEMLEEAGFKIKVE